jgi:hypothetical protein
MYRLPFLDAVLLNMPGHPKKVTHTNNFEAGAGNRKICYVFSLYPSYKTGVVFMALQVIRKRDRSCKNV